MRSVCVRYLISKWYLMEFERVTLIYDNLSPETSCNVRTDLNMFQVKCIILLATARGVA